MDFKRCTSSDSDFQKLVSELDAYLAHIDGEDHDFYAQFNGTDNLQAVIVAYNGPTAVGCGAIKEFSSGVAEVKRMYVLPEERSKGIAKTLLSDLEQWAMQLGYGQCILETGIRQDEAIALYHKSGYRIIPNYGQYEDVSTSICFGKEL